MSAEGDALRDELLEAARLHGEESEPEHEAGDLIEIVTACWELLSDEQRRAVHAKVMADWAER